MSIYLKKSVTDFIPIDLKRRGLIGFVEEVAPTTSRTTTRRTATATRWV